MPSGAVHDKSTIIGAAVAAPAYYFLTPPAYHATVDLVALGGAMLVSGLLLSPDLDLDSSIYHRWGPFRYLWWPYQRLIHHRSPLSHSFIIGPLLRIAYFLFWVWAIFRVVTWAITLIHPFDRNGLTNRTSDALVLFCRTHIPFVLAALVGLLLGAALHVSADLIVTGWKRKHHHRSHFPQRGPSPRRRH